MQPNRPIRVLYSFPHKLGAGRISNVAWQQVNGLVNAGADVTVLAGSICRPLPEGTKLHTTLAWKGLRLPYRLLGTQRACALHDRLVARRLEHLRGQVDVVHAWPMAALRTLEAALRLGIPTVLERPNAHTRYAYEVVQKECERLGVPMPAGHEHAYKADWLRREEEEYRLASRLLCPSDFVARTFVEKGFPPGKLARHQYGFDDKVFHPGRQDASDGRGLTVLFVGGCAPRKGLHYALEAWLQSTAREKGTFLIDGDFIPGYAEKLSAMLSHPSVKALGRSKDVAELMRRSDVLVLPSIEEGSALVTSEARASGCVLLVSDASGAACAHMENGLIHAVGDVKSLREHMDLLDGNRALIARLRAASLQGINSITWAAAGRRLLAVYQDTVKPAS